MLLILTSNAMASASFLERSQKILSNMEKNMQINLRASMKMGGPLNAIPFCHKKSLSTAKKEAGNDLEVGRTSKRLRNMKNVPPRWLVPLLEEYEKSSLSNPIKGRLVKLDDGKLGYVEPIYIENNCLLCHGKVSKEVADSIKLNFPQDTAVRYKLGEFRGLRWVKTRARPVHQHK